MCQQRGGDSLTVCSVGKDRDQRSGSSRRYVGIGFARDGESLVVLLGAVRAAGFVRDSGVLAIPAEAVFLAALTFLGCSYAFEFSLLIVCEHWLRTAGGTGAGLLFGGLLDDFAGVGFGVASVGRHWEDEDVVERTAYWLRVRVYARIDRFDCVSRVAPNAPSAPDPTAGQELE